MWYGISFLVGLAVVSSNVPSNTPMLVLSQMPDSTDILRTGSMEQLAYKVAMACPDSGTVLRYHRELLEPLGFTLCTPTVVKWLRMKTLTHEVAFSKSIFARESSGEFVILDVQCGLTSDEATGPRQDVSVLTIRKRSLAELKRVYDVACE